MVVTAVSVGVAIGSHWTILGVIVWRERKGGREREEGREGERGREGGREGEGKRAEGRERGEREGERENSSTHYVTVHEEVAHANKSINLSHCQTLK